MVISGGAEGLENQTPWDSSLKDRGEYFWAENPGRCFLLGENYR